MQKIILAQPRGFCAGVDRAITIVERAIEIYGKPIYVRHEIVHNKYVVDDLRLKGAIFVEEISDIPDGSFVIFSAHGVSENIELAAKAKNLNIIDATCPLVTKVHLEAKRNEREGRQIILIGHAGHPEVEGTSGRLKNKVILVSDEEDAKNITVDNPEQLAYVTQTTLSVDDTKKIIDILTTRFPKIIGPHINDICYATQNRQDAIKKLAPQVDMLLVIGAVNSSNSNRLLDLGINLGIKSYLINDYSDIDLRWFDNVDILGITAGASAPEILVEQVIEYLQKHFSLSVSLLDGIIENVQFKLPKEVR